MSETIVEWFGLRGGSDCGYCKSKSSKLNHGMWTHCMSCQVYEELLDRGWRRSGMYCYKPVMDRTCCPQYAIRCDVTHIKLSKSQKKVIKRFNKFLVNGKAPAPSNTNNVNFISDGNIGNIEDGPLSTVSLDDHIVSEMQMKTSKIKSKYDIVDLEDNSVTQIKSVKGADPGKPQCRKAKEIRLENKLLKLSKKSSDEFDVLNLKGQRSNEKSLEDFIDEVPNETCCRLEVKLVSVNDKKQFDPMLQTEFQLFSKYQQIIHGDSPDELNQKRFQRFLVDGPLKYIPGKSNNAPSVGLGAFHQQYFINEKLIAVGVLDILPHCVSSKYFFYDPDYSFLSLGTYSALREIYLTRCLNREYSMIKYYYMGYYIESCPKMKYKGNFSPSSLLCPETFTWQPLESCVPKLLINKYSRFEEDFSRESPCVPDVSEALILHKRRIMDYRMYIDGISLDAHDDEKTEIEEYVKLVGNVCDHALLYRS